ncbi:unnamed protein product, partial [Staurois parvus]
MTDAGIGRITLPGTPQEGHRGSAGQGKMFSSWNKRTLYFTLFTVMCPVGSLGMYYLLLQSFRKKNFFTEAIEKLESQPSALEILGAPPLKVHNLKLLDEHNRVAVSSARIRIPVSGSLSAGHLCSSAVRDQSNERWNLLDVVLELENGQSIPIYHSGIPAEDVKKSYIIL